MNKPDLIIFEQIDPAPVIGTRFKIAERNLTIDGYRTRLTDKAFEDRDEAVRYVKELRDES